MSKSEEVRRVCDCGLLVRPASECPTGKCLTSGRRARGVFPKKGERAVLFDKETTFDVGSHRWVGHDPQEE